MTQHAGPQSDKGKEMKNVLASMKDWISSTSATMPPKDAFQQMMNIGNSLTKVAAAMDPRLESFTAVVGDESAGKTVITMDLLKQVLLDVQTGTGTTVRTYVKQSYNPKLASSYQFDIKYDRNIPARSLSPVNFTTTDPTKMLEQYMALSKENRDKIEHNKKIDCNHICNVGVTCQEPDLGLQIMDHPGFAVTLEGPVKETFKKTLDEHFMGNDKKENATVLLCHRFGEQRSKSYYPTMCEEYYQKVNQGCMFMAITQVDRLASKEKFDEFAADLRGKWTGNKDSNGFPEVTPKDILDFIEKDYLFNEWEPGATEAQKLPAHTQLFFVCSYSGEIQKLLIEPDPKQRYDMFVKDPQKGRKKNEQTFWDTLFDVQKWEDAEIIMTVDKKDREDLQSRVGVESLSRALLRRQTLALEKVADAALQDYKKKYDKAMDEYREASSSVVNKTNNFANLSQMFMGKFVETYVTLTMNDPLNPESSGFAAQQPIQAQISGEIHRKFQDLKSVLGWDLDEEEKLFAALTVKGAFPPTSKDLTYDKWEIDRDLLKPLCIGKEEIAAKHWNISSLIRRFESQYAMLSCAIKAGPVNVAELQLDQRTSASQLSGDLKVPLSTHIQNIYEKIFRGRANQGSNMFVSSRVALICLMHGQAVMKLFKDVTEFKSLLGAEGAVREFGKDWDCKDNLLKTLPKCSRVQKPNYYEKLIQKLGVELSRHTASGQTLWAMMSNENIDSANPMEDFERVVIAQFFDCPYERLDNDLEKVVRKCSLCSPAYMAISHHYGPLFVHQDPEFLKKYSRQFSGDSFVTKLISAPADREGVSAFFEAMSDVLKEGGSDEQKRAGIYKVITLAGQCSQMFTPMGQMNALERLASIPLPDAVIDAAKATAVKTAAAALPVAGKGSFFGFGGKNAAAPNTAEIVRSHLHQFDFEGADQTELKDKQKEVCTARGIPVDEIHCRVAVTDKSGQRLRTESWMSAGEEQFPITLREVDPQAAPDRYEEEHEEAELYNNMDSETFSLIKSLNMHTNTSPMDRAKLLTSLIKSNRLPDTIIAFENAAWPKAWEVEWLNYVVQRQISAAAKRTLDDVLQTVASLLYSYQHGTQVAVQLKETRTRWCSLVLGYPYAFVPEERPRSMRFLDPEDVIQFMYRNKAYILSFGIALQQGGEPDDKGSDVPVLDYAIRQSPLFKHIVQLASHSEEKERAKAHAAIDKLYDLWLQTQLNQGGDGDDHNSNSVEKLTDEIMDLLLPVRYAKTSEGCRENKNLDHLRENCGQLHDAMVCLDSFAKFIRDHGSKLCTHEERMKYSDLKPDPLSATPDPSLFNIGSDTPLAELAPTIYDNKVDLTDASAVGAPVPHPFD